MLLLIFVSVDVSGRSTGSSARIEVYNEMGDKSSVDGTYDVAHHFGWNEEIQRFLKEYNPHDATAKVSEIASLWNSHFRYALNGYYESTGDKEAVCTRYRLKNLPCPAEHPLNEKMKELLSSFRAKPDPETYAEIMWTFHVIKRRVNAIESDKEAIQKKTPVRFQVAVPKVSTRKPFQWDDGIMPLDGTNWHTSAVAATTKKEYNPTVVAVGSSDTLVFAFEVEECNMWCAGTSTNTCIIVGTSYDMGQTMTPQICLHNPSRDLMEPAIAADPYRKIVYVAYSYPYSSSDYDIDVYVAHISDLLGGFFRTVANSFDMEITPYVNLEFNWGRSGCAGQWTSSCACAATDNWAFIGYNRNIDPYVERSTDCGNSWSLSYNDIPSDGSAYTSSQIMLETTNDPRSGSSVCSASNGGDNTIQGVFVESDASNDHEIWHIYTDASDGWGDSWTSTILINNYPHPINMPWLSVARTLSTSSMTHLILFESQYSSTDGDIRGIHASGLPPSGWSSVFNVDYTTIDSRTPTVHTDARWQWCPGAVTSTASYFHTAFYHKCPNTYDGRLCDEPPSSYNNTFRVVVMRAPWSSPTSWGPEYCAINLTYADTVAIPPPPSYSGGGLWQNWWQINGTTFRANPSTGAAWWFGALWVYNYSSTDWDVEWTILQCLLGNGDDDLSVGEARENVANMIVTTEGRSIVLRGEGKAEIYSLSGRLVSETDVRGTVKIPLSSGTYFVKTPDGVRRVIVR